MSLKHSTPYNTSHIKCHFCGDKHTCRVCPLEEAIAPILKKKVGTAMEYYIAEHIKCPECNTLSLDVIGDHTPSLDIICNNCSNKFEVKSKCLSVNKIPEDITLSHGLYRDYMSRLYNENLNLIVIIYGVDRINKLIKVKEVLYANNKTMTNETLVLNERRHNSPLSTICIKKKSALKKLFLNTKETEMSFKKDVDEWRNNIKIGIPIIT